MNPVTHSILRGGLMISCTLLVCSLFLILWAGTENYGNYFLYGCAHTMQEMAPAVLLITAIGSALSEASAPRNKK
jgi:hypothetical protein